MSQVCTGSPPPPPPPPSSSPRCSSPRAPTFTPDGQRIVFAFLPGDSSSQSYKVASIAVDGSDLRTAVGTNFIVGEQPRLQAISP